MAQEIVSDELTWSDGSLKLAIIRYSKETALSIGYATKETQAAPPDAAAVAAAYQKWLRWFKKLVFSNMAVILYRETDMTDAQRARAWQVMNDISDAMSGRILDSVKYSLNRDALELGLTLPRFKCRCIVVEQHCQDTIPGLVVNEIASLFYSNYLFNKVELSCEPSVLTSLLKRIPLACRSVKVVPHAHLSMRGIDHLLPSIVEFITRPDASLIEFQLDLHKLSMVQQWFKMHNAYLSWVQRLAMKRKATYVPQRVPRLLIGGPRRARVDLETCRWILLVFQDLAKHANRVGLTGDINELSCWTIVFITNFDTGRLLDAYIAEEKSRTQDKDDWEVNFYARGLYILAEIKKIYNYWRKLYIDNNQAPNNYDPVVYKDTIFLGASAEAIQSKDIGTLVKCSKSTQLKSEVFGIIQLAAVLLERLGAEIFRKKPWLTLATTPHSTEDAKFCRDVLKIPDDCLGKIIDFYPPPRVFIEDFQVESIGVHFTSSEKVDFYKGNYSRTMALHEVCRPLIENILTP